MLIDKTNKQNITKDTEIENRMAVTKGKRGGNFRGKGRVVETGGRWVQLGWGGGMGRKGIQL